MRLEQLAFFASVLVGLEVAMVTLDEKSESQRQKQTKRRKVVSRKSLSTMI